MYQDGLTLLMSMLLGTWPALDALAVGPLKVTVIELTCIRQTKLRRKYYIAFPPIQDLLQDY
jgi:hypothetical protein